MVHDLRIVGGAFELYAAENIGYPPNALPGVLPPGMDTYFGPSFNFAAPTAIGGNWDWANRKISNVIGVSVFNPTADDTQMREIDSIIDDGDLAQGSFQKIAAKRSHGDLLAGLKSSRFRKAHRGRLTHQGAGSPCSAELPAPRQSQGASCCSIPGVKSTRNGSPASIHTFSPF